MILVKTWLDLLSTKHSDEMSFQKERPRILFVYSGLSPFVRRDMEILEMQFNVKSLKTATFLKPGRGRNPLVFLTLLEQVLWSDIVYSWWADLNAFFIVLFCMLLRKKSVIVVGGYEAAYVPGINYGGLMSLSRRLEIKFILRHAGATLAVSKTSEKEILRFTKPKNLQVVYNGVDVERFKPLGEKQDLVLTVGTVSSSTIDKKRFDVFVEAAQYLPHAQFILIGKYDDSVQLLKQKASSNVTFKGYVSDKDLLRYYQKAKVYCQLSTQESFGVALAEAMACGCVPVVTRTYALPEVVGDAGYYAPYGDPKLTAETIREALKSDAGMRARRRIQTYFSLDAREKKLVAEILSLL